MRLWNWFRRFRKRAPGALLSTIRITAVLIRIGRLRSRGRYEEAIPLVRRAITLASLQLGEHDPLVANLLNEMAVLHMRAGDYAGAEPLLRQAMEIRRRVRGEGHPDVAASLVNLAGLYKFAGNYAGAETALRRALEIQRTASGECNREFGLILNDLALLYCRKGNYLAANRLFHRALEIQRRVLGPNHADFAGSLSNLAGLHKFMGNYAGAEPLYRQALAIRRRALGRGHPDFGASLSNLAGLLAVMGNHASAEALYRRALETGRAPLGDDHPDLGLRLNNLAKVVAARGRPDEALALMEQGAAIENRMIGQIVSLASENQRLARLTSLRAEADAMLSLLAGLGDAESPKMLRLVLDVVLCRKAVSLEAVAVQRDAVLTGQYPHLSAALEKLNKLRMQIAAKWWDEPRGGRRKEHQRILREWEARKEELERELARQIPEMNLERQLRAADRRAVALALPEGSALVELVRFNVLDFKAIPARGEKQWKEARYLAFVLPAGRPDDVQMVDLGEAKPIEAMIAAFREEIMRGGERCAGDLGAPTGEPASAGAAETLGRDLRARMLPNSLLDALGGYKRLFISPDGELNLFPFEALPLGDGKYVLDEYEISYVGTGRDVLRFGQQMGATGPAVVVADPDFALRGDGKCEESDRERGAGSESRRSASLDLGQFRLGRLPMTRLEGLAIVQRLKQAGIPVAEPWFGADALDSRAKRLRAPAILHISTHAKFLEDQDRLQGREHRGFGMGLDRSGFGGFVGPVPESPLLRSMLALAGVNAWAVGLPTAPDAEDGLLTAEDVCAMNLWGTELFAVPDCDTGLGKVLRGEGVFGFRRAAIQAGARTVLMSLWKVPDLPTAILMDRFYENLLERRMEKPVALHEAQRYVRGLTFGELRRRWLTDDVISQVPTQEGREDLKRLARATWPDDHRPFEHVWNWGAFICQGDPAPIGQVHA